MTQCNCPAQWVDLGGIKSQILYDCQRLCRKSFVQLNPANIIQCQANLFQCAWYRFFRADAHDFRRYTGDIEAEELKALDARINEVSKILASVKEVKKGEVILFDYVPGVGTRVSVAGTLKGNIEGADFNRALLKVWLGEKPVQEELKQSLLGKK